MISVTSVVMVVVWLIVVGLIFWLLTWLVDYCGLPEPFNKIAHVVLAVAAVVCIILILLGLVSGRPIFVP